MAILQRVSFRPNVRFDTQDARSIEAFSLNDWKYFLSGVMSQKSYVLKGFEISNYATAFTTSGIKIRLSDAVVFHPESTTQAAGFYVYSGTEKDSAPSLSAGATNYIEADFSLESGAKDIRALWDQGANSGSGGEYTQSMETALNLALTITSNVSGFTSGKVPLYKVVTNEYNVATQITDCRPMFFRLGSGGSSPDPSKSFSWPTKPDSAHARLETSVSATQANSVNLPFQGGDKNLATFKDWMDAVMTSLKEIKGTPYWYQAGNGGVPLAYMNSAMALQTGGTWQHIEQAKLTLENGSSINRLGFANAPALREFSKLDLSTHRVLFVLLPTSDQYVVYGFGQDSLTPIVPQAATAVTTSTLTVNTGGNYATHGGRLLIHGVEFSYELYNPYTGLFSSILPDPSGIVDVGDAVYQLEDGNTAFYHAAVPSLVPGLSSGTSMGAERVFWLAMYDGTHTIHLKNGDIDLGEQIQVGDETNDNIVTYIGSPNESTNNPTYAVAPDASKSGQTDYGSTAREDLTSRISRLTAMMADKAQDKTIQFVAENCTAITNSISGSLQALSFTGSSPVLKIVIPSSAHVGQIALIGELKLGVNQLAYVRIDRNAAFSVNLPNLTVVDIASAPLEENVFIVAMRLQGQELTIWDGRRFPFGSFGFSQELTTTARAKLGLFSETIYEPFTSLTQISATDSLPTAISKIDASIGTMLAEVPLEETIVVQAATTTITAQSMTWNPLNTMFDIVVYVNGTKQNQDATGGLTQDFRKTNNKTLQFSYTLPINAEITIREERTGGGGNSGGSTDLTNIAVNPSPNVNGGHSLGTTSKAWSSLYLRDSATSQVYKLQIVNGVFTITPI